MPNPSNNPGQTEKKEDGVLSAMTLLALPWLKFHEKMLDAVSAGIQDANTIKPFKRLAQHELQALMMIADPDGKWRNSVGNELEKKCESTYNEAIEKLAAGSISFIEAQKAFLTCFIDTVDKARTKASSGDQSK